jgi:hypothetical protein
VTRGPALVRLLVVVLALVVIAMASIGAVKATRSGLHLIDPSRRAPDQTLQTYQSIHRQFAAQVPAGSRVLLELPTDSLWRQRVVEIAMIQGVTIVWSADDADFKVSLAQAPPGVVVGGLRVVVERVR